VAEAKQRAELVTLSDNDLPEGDLLVRVSHSSLNYKDGLAMLGKPGVIRSYPLTCGVDLAGEVVEGGSGFVVGDQVVLTGAGLSETRPGGYSEYQRIEAAHAVRTPGKLGPWGAMAIGTAGLTAMLCVMRLESVGVTPEQGPVLVTGATGGVGSLAVWTLSQLGYEVHAATGKEAEHDYLAGLGATEIVSRESLTGESRPLSQQRWAGCVDSVGGATLANVLSQMKYSGVVTACGLAGGSSLPTTVLPFILRNVSLLGVESVYASPDLRKQAWARLDDLFSADSLRQVAVDATLEDLPDLCERILQGGIRGRVVVSLTAPSV
jgi:acrylyl-CoA reductase (NADPH)